MYLFKVMLVMAYVRSKKIIESTMGMLGCWPNTLWKVLVERTMHYPCKVKNKVSFPRRRSFVHEMIMTDRRTCHIMTVPI